MPELTISTAGRTWSQRVQPGSPGELTPQDGVTVRWSGEGSSLQVAFVSEGRLRDDVTLTMTLDVHAESASWPSYQGVFHRTHEPVAYGFRGPGWVGGSDSADRRLALPLGVVESESGLWAVGVDPLHEAVISVGERGDVSLSWTYLAAAGEHAESRRVFVAGVPTLESALDVWFSEATPDVPAGPDWLQDIGWAHYDYMSDNGQGWYDDLTAIAEIVPPRDRSRVAVTLHAWYDRVGRYTYDSVTGELDREWTVFPFVEDERVIALEGFREGGRQPNAYTFRNLRNHHPLAMTWEDIRRRIRFAKELGFRVPFYLTTGLMNAGDPHQHIAEGSGLDVIPPLWIGPDSIGQIYLRNPLDPEVRTWFLGLVQAILDEVGDLIDALVFDEAYYIGYGQLGPDARPGYADAAQATLLQEAAALCHAVRPDIAFLTADHVGTQHLEDQAYPYSLLVDGIYHDAWSHSQSWEASRFPTWRNVTWSCNWAPESEIFNTRWAVLAYDAPIGTGHGCFGDDVGFNDMDPSTIDQFRELWTYKSKRRIRVDTFERARIARPTPESLPSAIG